MADRYDSTLIVPPSTKYFIHRLVDNAQPSTNILRVNALNSTVASQGGLVIVRLPMAFSDLSTFAWHFETNAGQLGLPKGIEGVISRLEVAVNGLGLLNLQQYGLLFNLLKESHMGLDKLSARAQLQNETDNSVVSVKAADSRTVYKSVLTASSTNIVVKGYTTTNEPLGAVDAVNVAVTVGATLGIATNPTGITAAATTQEVDPYTGIRVTVVNFTMNYASAPVIPNATVRAPYTVQMDSNLTYVAPTAPIFHTVSDFLGFFKAQPRFVQLQALGEVEVRITLAGTDITLGNNFDLKNIYFSIRTCSFDNNFADAGLTDRLANGGIAEMTFPNYYNVNQTQSAGATQTRFSVNTQSLDKVIACNRPSYFASATAPSAPCGLGVKSQLGMGIVKKTAPFQTYACNPSGQTVGDAAVTPNTYQFQLNNQFVPNYKVSPQFAHHHMLEAYGLHNDYASGTTFASPLVYMNACYQMVIALDFQDPEIIHGVLGVDTRGSVSVAYLNQDSQNAGDRTDIFTCFTSILRIGANQQVQVVM